MAIPEARQTPPPEPEKDVKGSDQKEALTEPKNTEVKVQERRDQAKNASNSQEKAQDDLLTRIAQLTALGMNEKLATDLGNLYKTLGNYQDFRQLNEGEMRLLKNSDAIIRGMVAAERKEDPNEVDAVAPINPQEVKAFIERIFSKASAAIKQKVDGPWNQPKPTETVQAPATEPKNSPTVVAKREGTASQAPNATDSPGALKGTAIPDKEKALTGVPVKNAAELNVTMFKKFTTFGIKLDQEIKNIALLVNGKNISPKSYKVININETRAMVGLVEVGGKDQLNVQMKEFNPVYEAYLKTPKKS